MKKNTALIILMAFLVLTLGTFNASGQSAEDNNTPADLTLVVGSPLVLSGADVKRLDAENPDIAPKLVSSRTLIPLRAIAEHFGALVSYNGQTEEATISYAGREAIFKPSQKSFEMDGNTYPLDVAAQLSGGRMLVPLRAVAETVLNKTVSYYSGVIYIGENVKDLKNDAAYLETVTRKIGEARRPQTVEELKSILAGTGAAGFNNKEKSVVTADSIKSPAPAADQSVRANGAAGDYSKTNIQVEGIDEADIVKTDGKNLYVAASRTVYVVSAEGSDMKVVSKIEFNDNRNISELYAADGRLVVIGHKYSYGGGDVRIMDEKASMSKSMIMPPLNNKTMVFVDVYDLSDSGKPVKVRGFEVEGNLSTSRKNGDYLYVVANKYVYMYGIKQEGLNDADVMPLYRDGENSELKPVGVDRIICPPYIEYPSYATIASIDLSDPEKAAGVESILGASDRLYMNANSIYLARPEYKQEGVKTAITRFSVDGMKIGYAASGTVPGNIQDQFWMDEKDGYLRAATTDSTNGNSLFVLDGSLNTVGSITGIAKGERIYSVRYIGNAGYIVTFRTMDPLFAIDLSDPKNPVIKGELKIPGFSDYLHPVGENLLLGIGRETREMFVRDKDGKETVVGIFQGGIKLSLFDVSNLEKPVEKEVLILGGSGSYAEALYNHKAIMTDPANGIIGFDASLYDGVKGVSEHQGAVLIKAGESGLSEAGRIAAKLGENEEARDKAYVRRIAYIGDTLYYVQDGWVRAFDYQSLKELTTLVLK